MSSTRTKGLSFYPIAPGWSPVNRRPATRCRRSVGSARTGCRPWPLRRTARSCSTGRGTSSLAAPPRNLAIARKSIVTRTGDGGETGLLYGGRVAKTEPRTEAYGDVDEAISALGSARALINDRGRHAIILRVQSELFTVGAELATDAAEDGTPPR